MSYNIIEQGYVTERSEGTDTSSVAGPRCVVGASNEIICTFVAQTKLGANDFKPMITRSFDNGHTWDTAKQIWPEQTLRFSIYGSISKTPTGDLLFYGTRTPIDEPGESFWSPLTQGLLPNELIWSRSRDGGHTWSDFKIIKIPYAGSAEAPGPMCATRNGRLLCCYAPSNTFDAKVKVERNKIVCLWSDDDGSTWQHSTMLKFPFDDSSGAVAWLMELDDSRLLGTAWHIRESADEPNAFAISSDSGKTWKPTGSTGIFGQSTSLAALPGGRALFVYNQRKYGDIGVWMAVVRPTDNDFGIEHNASVWKATRASKIQGKVNHDTWTDFAFGEPSVLVLPSNEILVTLWSAQRSGADIVYVKLRMN